MEKLLLITIAPVSVIISAIAINRYNALKNKIKPPSGKSETEEDL